MTYQQRRSKIKRWGGGGGGGLKIKLEISSQSGKTSLRCAVTFFKKMGVGHAYNKRKLLIIVQKTKVGGGGHPIQKSESTERSPLPPIIK